ncbi:hypothetical protein [Paenibacillus chitinolyticus]|uniref:hypothetical protein n=1 Tax=Paenibacillus chitinolyticus TaxID=79263 RepID=UPI00366B9A77
MNTRILHCGKSIANYLLCVDNKVVGFTKRTALIGDMIYLAVKVGGKSICGARGRIIEPTDLKPWEDAEIYVQSFIYDNLEFCRPFDISCLSVTGGKHWGLRYVQSSKLIKDEEASKLLDALFHENKTRNFNRLQDVLSLDNEDALEDEFDDDQTQHVFDELPEERINIMGTFLTVKFYNETDPIRGLETLVNDNFYNLFEDYPKSKTILIPENRMFVSAKAVNSKRESVNGTSGIPDGVLIKFNKQNKNPIQINLIEYECYGESKTKSIDKFEYLNGHIIPQLMRFASTFSIVTDNKIREETVKKWTEKIIDYIFNDNDINNKFTSWIRELQPDISERRISLEMHNLILEAFRENLRIILIIDELTIEQRETIKNIIQSFKLNNGKGIEFLGYVVRLEQKINLINTEFEYALAVQK